jgi:sulfoxide reductase heme-binding subunit YedZ
MRYRGLDPRTRPLRWAVFLAAVVVVLAATGGGALDALRTWVTAEQERIPWYATRILGLLAYLVLAGSVIYGLLLSTGILDAFAHRTVSFTLHQDLSAIGLGLALVHAALLTLDHSVPFTVAEVFLPFTGPYRPLWVGIGQLSLILTVVVVASFSLRRRIGQKRWRTLHYVTFLAFAGATAHGLMAAVVFLTAYRIVLAVALRRTPAATRPAPRAGREVVERPPAGERGDAAA